MDGSIVGGVRVRRFTISCEMTFRGSKGTNPVVLKANLMFFPVKALVKAAEMADNDSGRVPVTGPYIELPMLPLS